MKSISHSREFLFIAKIIKDLKINLSGYTVLTEIGNNFYFYVPFIAAMAGAKKVFVWTKDNPHFDCYEIVARANQMALELSLQEVIEISINERPIHHIKEADIITNSGFVRPLNASFLQFAKQTVVIPLMFEAWELRNTDIDIDYCRQLKIKVAGTWENHPSIKVFDSVGPLAVKLAFEANLEVYQNNILVWSDDEFGRVSANYFKKMGANNILCTTNKEEALSFIKEADFIYFCSNHEKRPLISNISPDAIFNIDEVLLNNPLITIVHLYGNLDYEELRSQNLTVYPPQNGQAEYMSKTLSHIGMIPTLNLFAAGFKVGQELITNKTSDLTQIISPI